MKYCHKSVVKNSYFKKENLTLAGCCNQKKQRPFFKKTEPFSVHIKTK